LSKINAITNLTGNINQVVRLTKDEITVIEKVFNKKEVGKGKFWIKQGTLCNEVA